MRKILRSIMVIVFICLLSSVALGADLIVGDQHEFFFYNYENVYDANGNYKSPNQPLSVGDHFAGILAVQNIDVGGTTIFYQSPSDQLKGVFAQRVVAIYTSSDPFAVGPQELPHIVLGPPTINTFCKAGDCFSMAGPDGIANTPDDFLRTGEIFAFYRYTGPATNTLESNGTLLDDVTKAATGNLWLTLGYEAGLDNFYGSNDDSGYYYAHAIFNQPLVNFGGRSYGALNAIINNTGYNFCGLNDIDEYESGGLGLLNDVVFSSELEANPLSILLGRGTSPWDFRSNDPATMLPCENPCVDIEKEVSVDGLPLLNNMGTSWNPAKVWFDADAWADAPTTGMAAVYRLIVTNCGDIPLTNVTLKDIVPTSTSPETIVFNNVNIGTLQPGESKVIVAGWIGAPGGPVSAVSGFTGLNAPNRCQDNWVSVYGAPEGMYLNTARVTTDQNVSDEDPAWVSCRLEEPGACRMTGGSETTNYFFDTEGDQRVFINYVDGTYNNDTKTSKVGTGKKAVTQTTWVTTGGQIGAPSTNPATGHWEHTQHAGADGNFTFLAGTASAPQGTEISHIACADPGWCVQARCAPFKQQHFGKVVSNPLVRLDILNALFGGLLQNGQSLWRQFTIRHAFLQNSSARLDFESIQIHICFEFVVVSCYRWH